MNTEQLVLLLAEDDTPSPPIAPRLLAGSGLAMLASAALVLSVLGIRPDLALAMSDPLTLMKWLLPLAVALPALRAALRLSRPQTRRVPEQLVVGVVAAVALCWLTLAVIAALPAGLWPAMRGYTAPTCLTMISLMSILPLSLGLMVLRAGATPAPMRCGAMLGMATGGFGAALYALHCNEDAPLFFLTWYGLAILISTAAGALAGSRLLRW